MTVTSAAQDQISGCSHLQNQTTKVTTTATQIHELRTFSDQTDRDQMKEAEISPRRPEGRKEMFYLTTHSTHFIYGYMVKDHSDSERGNPLRPHRLLFLISSKGSFICIIPDRITHTTAFVTPVVEHWVEREIAQWVHPKKDRSVQGKGLTQHHLVECLQWYQKRVIWIPARGRMFCSHFLLSCLIIHM